MKQVTPTSRKTSGASGQDYLVLHRGLDTLELNIRQRVPRGLGDLLKAKRSLADEIGRPVEFEQNGVRFSVSPHGVQGGFQYHLVCPKDDTKLLLRKPNARPNSGVRVVFRFRYSTSPW